MPSFKLERDIPPSEVTIDLLRRLERLLLVDVASRSAIPANAPAVAGYSHHYQLTIIDSFGQEALETIDDYRPLLLPDTTTGVNVTFSAALNASSRIDVRVAFRLEHYLCNFTVEVNGDSAREIAIGVAERISQVLAPQRRAHLFLYLGPSGLALRFTVGLVGIMLTVGGVRDRNVAIANAGIVMLCAAMAHWYAADKLRPYIIFDSQLSKRRRAVWNWFVAGTLGFLVFGTLFVWIRRWFFGF